MKFIDVLSLTLNFLGVYDPILPFRYLIPCYIIPLLLAHLNATQQLLDHAEATDSILRESEYRTGLDRLANQFAAMRVESNHARGPIQQLRLAIPRGLTCRLYVLYYQIGGVKSNIELAVDKEQLRIADRASRTAVPSPLAQALATQVTATPAKEVVDPTLPLPATYVRILL